MGGGKEPSQLLAHKDPRNVQVFLLTPSHHQLLALKLKHQDHLHPYLLLASLHPNLLLYKLNLKLRYPPTKSTYKENVHQTSTPISLRPQLLPHRRLRNSEPRSKPTSCYQYRLQTSSSSCRDSNSDSIYQPKSIRRCGPLNLDNSLFAPRIPESQSLAGNQV